MGSPNYTPNAALPLSPDVRTEAEAIATLARGPAVPDVLEVTSFDGSSEEVLTVPNGRGGFDLHLVDKLLEPLRTAPKRRKGQATFTDLTSFIAHVRRFADEDSVIFAESNPGAPSAALTAVLDYHHAGAHSDPRFGEHTSRYNFPFSEEWLAWGKVSGKSLGQADFAQLLEDRIADVADPTHAGPSALSLRDQLGVEFASPSSLVGLSRGIEVNIGKAIHQATKLASGETRVVFAESHTDGAGAPLRIPGAFLLGVPVFRGGALYQVPARLRYRASGTTLLWTVDLYRLDKSFEHALREACAKVEEETALPLYYGSPELDE